MLVAKLLEECQRTPRSLVGGLRAAGDMERASIGAECMGSILHRRLISAWRLQKALEPRDAFVRVLQDPELFQGDGDFQPKRRCPRF